MFHDSAFDRCIDDLSSTLELAKALERQLEQVHRTVSQACDNAEPGDDSGPDPHIAPRRQHHGATAR